MHSSNETIRKRKKPKLYIFSIHPGKYIVSCQGVVQLGGLVQGSPGSVSQRLRLISLINFVHYQSRTEYVYYQIFSH